MAPGPRRTGRRRAPAEGRGSSTPRAGREAPGRSTWRPWHEDLRDGRWLRTDHGRYLALGWAHQLPHAAPRSDRMSACVGRWWPIAATLACLSTTHPGHDRPDRLPVASPGSARRASGWIYDIRNQVERPRARPEKCSQPPETRDPPLASSPSPASPPRYTDEAPACRSRRSMPRTPDRRITPRTRLVRLGDMAALVPRDGTSRGFSSVSSALRSSRSLCGCLTGRSRRPPSGRRMAHRWVHPTPRDAGPDRLVLLEARPRRSSPVPMRPRPTGRSLRNGGRT